MVTLLVMHKRGLKFIIRGGVTSSRVGCWWEARAEVDCGVQRALKGLRVVIEADTVLVLMSHHHKLMLALVTSSSPNLHLMIILVATAHMMSRND